MVQTQVVLVGMSVNHKTPVKLEGYVPFYSPTFSGGRLVLDKPMLKTARSWPSV